MTAPSLVRVALAATVLLAACGREEPGRVEAPAGPAAVVVSPLGAAAGALSFPAEVVAGESADVATRVSGTVRRVAVDVGSRVAAGQLLVALESEDVGAGVSGARAAVVQARRYRDRIAGLEKDGAATPQELDDADARLAMAEAELRAAGAQMGYVNLTAPFAGVITERRVDPGDLVVPGQPVVTVVSTTGGVEVRADLPAERADLVKPGVEVTVVAPASGIRVPARIARVVPALERGSRRFRVEVELATPPGGAGLLPGSFARLELPSRGAETRWAPADAMVRRGQLSGVFTVEDDTLRLRWVRLGQERDGAVEVLAGLAAGARVVRRPGPGLADGTPVGRVESEPWSPTPAAETAEAR